LTEIRAILWHLFLPCRAIPDDHRAEVFFRRVEVKNYRGVSPFGSRLRSSSALQAEPVRDFS